MFDFISMIVGMPPAVASILTIVYVHVLVGRIGRKQHAIGGRVDAIAKYMGVEIASGAHVVKPSGKVKSLMLLLACFLVCGCATSSMTRGTLNGQPVELFTNGTTGPDPVAIAAVGKAAGVGLADGLGLGHIVAAVTGLAGAAGGSAYLLERKRRQFHEADAAEAYAMIHGDRTPFNSQNLDDSKVI
jgi:hypothetical protein